MTPMFETGELVHVIGDGLGIDPYVAVVNGLGDGVYYMLTADSRNEGVPMSRVRPGWPASIDPRVKAIRADSMVGRGSCSVIDECWTDEEIQVELDAGGIKRSFSKQAATKAVTRMRAIHRTWSIHADEIIKTGEW